jgi:hypothetical protein
LALLRGLDPIPAYITSRAMDVLAWNPAMATLLLDFAALPAAERNMVRLTFLHPPMRQLWTDWDAAADESVANVRAATARFPDDPALISLVGELTIASPDFASRWARHDVKNKVSGRKRLSHPVAGPLNLAYEVLTLEADGHRLFTYLPADAATAEALATLLGPPSGRRTPAPTGLRVVG